MSLFNPKNLPFAHSRFKSCNLKVFPTIISSSQTGYVSQTEDVLVKLLEWILDFDKAFYFIEWKYLQNPQNWVTVLYNDISSCVLKNGFATKHFNLGRGVRQGCPLSGILFIIGIGILSNAIKSSDELKGISINEVHTVKISQYANDSNVYCKGHTLST